MKKINKSNYFYKIIIIIFILFFLFLVIGKSEVQKTSVGVNKELEKEKKVDVIVDIRESEKINSARERYGNSVVMSVNKKELKQLENDERVLRIREAKEIVPMLQDSTVLTNTTITWSLQQNNINLTGTGETICEIDSGINYSHPDLGGCIGAGCKILGGWDFNSGSSQDSDPMDYYGHGTHVAGILAANGSIKGIAPGANLVIVKVFSDAGAGGSELTLANAIQWCVDNSSIYNISVISMSLGFIDNKTSSCDSDISYADVVTAVNNAAAKNISVIAAAGNDYNYTAITPPACITNVTAVGASTKTDVIASYSNRNSLVKLLGPGGDNTATGGINSTYLSGYSIASGTSMATPHVAGAYALVRQFFKLEYNRVPTPAELLASLNNTGRIINDSLSVRNYSRIDVYDAIISLDINNPNVTLISPGNNNLSINRNQTFSCNSTDLALKNMSFYLFNSSNYLVNSSSGDVSGNYNLFSTSINNLNYESYNWACKYFDRKNNSFITQNFTIRIGGIVASQLTPVNNNYTNNNISFLCNSESETNYILKNVTFYLWNSSGLIYNKTENISGLTNITTFPYNFTLETSYNWSCQSYNNNSNSSFASNFSIVYDITPPNITVILPENSVSSTTSDYNFTFNVSDVDINYCELIFDSSSIHTLNSVSVILQNGMYNSSLAVGSHEWDIKCYDKAGNIANSSSRTLTVTSAPVTKPSSGGGGGGGGVPVITTAKSYAVDDTKFSSSVGYSQVLGINEKVNFTVNSEKHELKLKNVSNSRAEIEISSNIIKLNLSINEEKKLNFGDYSVIIKLNSIVNNKADILFRKISNLANQNNNINNTNNNTDIEVSNQENKRGISIWLIILAIIIVVVLLFFTIRYMIVRHIKWRKLRGK